MPADLTVSTAMAEVIMVRWPDEREKASRLAAAGVPLLYVVNGNDDPPPITSCLADWVRMPGDERDLDARLAALEQRATGHQSPPHVDAAGSLHYRGAIVHLQPHEARLAVLLTDHFDEVVADEALRDAAEVPAARSLQTEITHLRNRLRPAGLAVQRIRGRGYRLHGR